ncbi:MAG: hypothetical protein ABGZ35_03320 [Planctomycetaceae bacterium]
MLQRACPRCHLQIPDHMLALQPRFISIAGAPRSGKTYFLTIMLHQLKKSLSHQFKYTLGYSDSHEKRMAVDYEEKLFSAADATQPVMLPKTETAGDHLYNTVHLDGVDVQLPKPFMLTLRKTVAGGGAGSNGRTEGIVLYDNAGESFRLDAEDSGKQRSTQHLSESDAVLFTYDPLLETETRARLAEFSDDPQIHDKASSARQVDYLEEVIHRMRRHRGVPDNQPMDVALAVCIQKYDVWKPLVDFHRANGEAIIDATSIEYRIKHGIAGLDLTEINIISAIVRSMLNDTSPQFVALAETHFRHVRYFPVSALGHSPQEHDGFLKIRPIDIQSFRADHPFLWLMRRWDMIDWLKNKRENPKSLPVASARSLGHGMLEVRCPTTGEPLHLDADHAGREFYNPNSSQFFWIPKVQLRNAARPAKGPAAASREPTRPQGLGLKLDSVDNSTDGGGASKKRRWWPFS